MSTLLILLSTIATAVATVFIAVYSRNTLRLSKQISQSQDEFQGQLADLYQAIVIATLLSANSDPSVLPGYIQKFKEVYKGGTTIFK